MENYLEASYELNKIFKKYNILTLDLNKDNVDVINIFDDMLLKLNLEEMIDMFTDMYKEHDKLFGGIVNGRNN